MLQSSNVAIASAWAVVTPINPAAAACCAKTFGSVLPPAICASKYNSMLFWTFTSPIQKHFAASANSEGLSQDKAINQIGARAHPLWTRPGLD